MDESAVAFFCVADGPRYVPKAITTLRSIRRFHPGSGYFVVGKFSADSTATGLVARNELRFLHLDLTRVFSATRRRRVRHGTVSWPSECFWWTHAHTSFGELGYDYSCAVDGDVLCVSPLHLDDVVDPDTTIAGVAKRGGRINSGVLFLNNARLDEIDFSDSVCRVYETEKSCRHRRCTGHCRRLGDQELLAELERLGVVRPRRIPNSYNHLLSWNPARYVDKNPDAPFPLDRSHLVHLLAKPWGSPPRLRRLNPIAVDGYRAWWEFAREVWPDASERAAYFGEERARLRRGPVPSASTHQ